MFLRCLKECAEDIDETEFYYKNALGEDEYCIIGYISEYDPTHPYWAGYGCDAEHGMDFASADELVNSKVFGGKSIRERWEEIYVFNLGMVNVEYWMKHLCSFKEEVEFLQDIKLWRLKENQRQNNTKVRAIGDRIFLSVVFDKFAKKYCYLTDDDSIAVGDHVLVPVGCEGRTIRAIVKRVDYLPESKAPIPFQKIKPIIRKFDNTMDL